MTGTPANDAEKALKDEIAPIYDEMGKLGDAIRSEDKDIANAAEKKYDEFSEKSHGQSVTISWPIWIKNVCQIYV